MSAVLRPATVADAPAIQEIYAHHVLHGFGTFEEEPPGVTEICERMAAVADRNLPWLVSEIDGRVAGYAYAGPFRLRSAYRFTAETSVYISAQKLGLGIGKALLTRLLADCEAAGVRQMLAMICDSANARSIALHRALGFEQLGVFRNVGFKAGRWLDVVAMQRSLGEMDNRPAPDDRDGHR
jgi:phosphinothricin acetyltransferase